MNVDELDPPRPTLEPKDLQTLSVEELKAYVVALEKEIARAEAMIDSKDSHRAGANSLFNMG